jgi:nitroreductase
VGNSVGRRYRYGSSFVDEASGVRFEGHHPLERPDLWKRYLNEAEGRYRSHGFEDTLRRRDLEEGHGVPLFFIGFAPDGEAVAGVRFHGPLESSHQAALIEEMAESPEIDDIAAMIDGEVRLGVLEVKGAWSKGEALVGARLIAAITRSASHAMTWLGAETAVAAVSDALVPVGMPAGGRQYGTHWVPFPDDRYRTVCVYWRRSRSQELATPEHQVALRREAEQLSRGPIKHAASPIEADSTRTMSYQAMVLDVATRSQREVMRVLREDPSLQLVDRLGEQREELAGVRPTPSRSLMEESPRWVYFPWRRAMVRLLAPRAFVALRLDRNRNKMTREEQARLRSLRVGVVGLSAGHSVAHVLAMEGLVGELRLADFDTVALSNLNRLPGSVLDLGVNKAVVAARRIAEIDPYLRVVVVPEGITPENLGEFLDGLDVVIEECDSIDMKFLVREAARERRIPVIMETSDRGILDVERFDLEPHRSIFHGLFGEMDSSQLAGLSLAQKGPYVARLIGPREASSRGAASFLEVGSSITAWPQLASEITLGAASIATAVRRLGMTGDLPSGRVRIDLEEIVASLTDLEVDTRTAEDLASPAPEDEPLWESDLETMMVDAARRAPSGGNIQPWRFEVGEGEVRFYLVPERTSIWDVRYRGSYLAIGAALFNARVAAASRKQLGQVRLFPEGRPTNHVATLFTGQTPDIDLARLLPYVVSRITNRRTGEPAPLVQSEADTLTRAVEREGARLILRRDDELRLGAELLAEADRLRFLIPAVHEHMREELRWPGRDTLDEGLDVRTLELDPGGYAAVELLSRPEVVGHLADWRVGSALGFSTKMAVESSSALAAIVVPRAEPVAYVRAGSALERFWLNAERLGLAVHPMVPLTLYATSEQELVQIGGERRLDEMVRLAEQLREYWELSEGETAVMVMRVFHAPRPSVHSSRLSLEEVLSRDPTEPPTAQGRALISY